MNRLAAFVRRHIPTRETIHENPFLRPFARHLSRPDLWQFNRRSVPRAVAIGLGVGVLLPLMHMVVAALLAVPARANIAIAAAVTLVVNPLTIPPMYWAAYRIGSWELHRGNEVDPATTAQVSGELARFLFWVHEASGPIALGILTLAGAGALIGYACTYFVWRGLVARRYHGRHARRRAERRR